MVSLRKPVPWDGILRAMRRAFLGMPCRIVARRGIPWQPQDLHASQDPSSTTHDWGFPEALWKPGYPGILVREWGLYMQAPQAVCANSGIELFSDGTCDVLVTASPLSESQAAPLIRHAPALLCIYLLMPLARGSSCKSKCHTRQCCCRSLNRTIMEVPVAVHARKFVHSWQPWSELLKRHIFSSDAFLPAVSY